MLHSAEQLLVSFTIGHHGGVWKASGGEHLGLMAGRLVRVSVFTVCVSQD